MSTTMKWGVAVLVVAVLIAIAWWAGLFGSATGATQSAAAINSFAPASAQNLTPDLAALDAQLGIDSTDLTSLTAAQTQTKIGSVAAEFQTSIAAMRAISAKLETSVVASGKAKASLLSAWNDLTHQIGNASSQVATVLAGNKSSKASVLQQGVQQLQVARAYMQSARTDMQTIVTGLSTN